MGIRPLHDRVLVETNKEAESKTASGIIIPDSAKEKPMEGKVVAVGNGRLDKDGNRVALEVKVGDTVIYGKYAGTEVKTGGKEFLLMREDDILGIIE